MIMFEYLKHVVLLVKTTRKTSLSFSSLCTLRYPTSTTILTFIIKGHAASELTATLSFLKKLSKVYIHMDKPGGITFVCRLCDVRIRNEAPTVIGPSCNLHSIPNSILSNELLYKAVKHIAKESHSGMRRIVSMVIMVDWDCWTYDASDFRFGPMTFFCKNSV
jgi:hypothetical protein